MFCSQFSGNHAILRAFDIVRLRHNLPLRLPASCIDVSTLDKPSATSDQIGNSAEGQNGNHDFREKYLRTLPAVGSQNTDSSSAVLQTYRISHKRSIETNGMSADMVPTETISTPPWALPKTYKRPADLCVSDISSIAVEPHSRAEEGMAGTSFVRKPSGSRSSSAISSRTWDEDDDSEDTAHQLFWRAPAESTTGVINYSLPLSFAWNVDSPTSVSTDAFKSSSNTPCVAPMSSPSRLFGSTEREPSSPLISKWELLAFNDQNSGLCPKPRSSKLGVRQVSHDSMCIATETSNADIPATALDDGVFFDDYPARMNRNQQSFASDQTMYDPQCWEWDSNRDLLDDGIKLKLARRESAVWPPHQLLRRGS